MEKVVVITGGTSGIGKELASIFKANGDIVYVLARNVNEQNQFAVDVCDENAVMRAIQQIGNRHGKIDVVINSAGYGLAGAMELTSLDDAKKEFDTNFFGTFLVNKYAIPFMKSGSKIVNISSACALFALPYRGLYCASKSAVNMYSESLSMELKKSGIKVVTICPGDVKTNFCSNRIKVFETNERYGDSIQKSLQKVDGNQQKRMSAEYVAKTIYKKINKKSPKNMYIIGKKYKFLYFCGKILPKQLMLHLTNKMFNK